MFSLGSGRNHRLCLPFGQNSAEMVGVVAFVGQQFLERSGGADEGVGHADVGHISGAQQQDARAALFVHQAMDLGGAAASGAAYALSKGPPLAPAAERWALIEVLSMAAEE